MRTVPGTVAGLIPWWISRWELQPPFFGLEQVRWVGVLLIALSLPVLLESFGRFAVEGLGEQNQRLMAFTG